MNDKDKPLKRHWLLAGVLGAVSPGLGHAYLGFWKSAFVCVGLVIGLLLLTGLTLGAWPYGVASVHIAGAAIPLLSGLAAVQAWRKRRSINRDLAPGLLRLVAFNGATLLIGMAAALMVREVGAYRPFHIPNVGMLPTVKKEEIIVVRRLGPAAKRSLKAGSAVVFKTAATSIRPAEFYLKRIVAVGGETIAFDNGVPVIDGAALSQTETGIEHLDGDYPVVQATKLSERLDDGAEYTVLDAEHGTGALDNVGPFRVPPGHVFLLGDNRDYSQDSRTSAVGFVPVDALFGEVLFIGWSSDFDRIGEKLN